VEIDVNGDWPYFGLLAAMLVFGVLMRRRDDASSAAGATATVN
jgi:hypothetical protein